MFTQASFHIVFPTACSHCIAARSGDHLDPFSVRISGLARMTRLGRRIKQTSSRFLRAVDEALGRPALAAQACAALRSALRLAPQTAPVAVKDGT